MKNNNINKNRIGNLLIISIEVAIILIAIVFSGHSANIEEEYLYKKDSIQSEKIHTLVGKYYLEKHNSEKYSDSACYALLNELGCYYPDIVMAQAQYESHKGKSKIALSHNNYFGMKNAMKRQTCRNYTTDAGGYARYYNWQLSVIDRVLWDFSIFPEKPTRKEYLNKIEHVYGNEKQNYVKELLKVLENN